MACSCRQTPRQDGYIDILKSFSITAEMVKQKPVGPFDNTILKTFSLTTYSPNIDKVSGTLKTFSLLQSGFDLFNEPTISVPYQESKITNEIDYLV